MKIITLSPLTLRQAAEREGINLELFSSNGFPVEDLTFRPQDGTDVVGRLNQTRTVATVTPKSLIGQLFLSILVEGG